MKTTLIATLCALLGVSQIQTITVKQYLSRPINSVQDFEEDDWHFTNFVSRYQRNYRTKDEWLQRRENFRTNMQRIKDHNETSDGSYQLGLNKFSDLSDTEFKTMMGFKPLDDEIANATQPSDPTEDDSKAQLELPSFVDWRTQGAVPPVRNQYSCGACYAFSSTAAMESLYYIKHQVMTVLSVQQIIDCSGSYGNHQCTSGSMVATYRYAQSNPIMKESDYPFIYRYTGYCRYNNAKGVMSTTGYSIPSGSVSALMTAVAQQPVTVGISASAPVMQQYVSGIITGTACGTSVDHGVVIVGYGTSGSTNYWIVRNSWGSTWGESGYVRIDRSTAASGPSGVCGILTMLSYPTM